MATLAIIIEFEPHPERRMEFLEKLRSDARQTLRDDGCLRMEILHASDDRNRILLCELWRDRQAIEAHRNKPGHSHAWQDALIRSKRVIVCETDS
jgi:quinol monooxygenase YgiN